MFGITWGLRGWKDWEGASGRQWAESRISSQYGLVLHNQRRLLAPNSKGEGQDLESSPKDDKFLEPLETKVSFFVDITNHLSIYGYCICNH